MIGELQRVAGRPVSRETLDRLGAFVGLLERESERQNLISNASLQHVWRRHILDSAQLIRFEPRAGASWVDVGSGAGLPGIVIACLVGGPVTLIEPRRLRAEFLQDVIHRLDLKATVAPARADKAEGKFDVITARAVAPLDRFLGISHHLSTRKTIWALPRGRNAQSELAEAERTWQGVFHVEQSATDEESYIVVGTNVRARAR